MDNKLYQPSENSKTIFDKTIDYIESKYLIRFNEIGLEYEICSKKEKEWEILNINSLYIELNQSDVKISLPKLEILLRSHLIESYNPIQAYFSQLNWDGHNHIAQLASHIITDDEESFYYHLEKWLTRAVLCALEKGKVNKQCIVLSNQIQNSGKTTFLRFLIPEKLNKYYTENISTDKDGNIAICKNLICNTDELSIMSKSDVNVLKAFISKSSVNVRLPYGRKVENLERISSFVGSTNKTDFLTDETGSVRWLIFEVLSIDFDYTKNVNIDQVWAQAYYNAYKRENFNPELTAKDIEHNELRNQRYAQISIEHEIILKFYVKSEDSDDFLTATDIMLEMNPIIGIKLNNIRIGKALTFLKFKRIKHPKLQVYGYLLKRK